LRQRIVVCASLALVLAGSPVLTATEAGFGQGAFYATSWKSKIIAHFDAAGGALPPLAVALPQGAHPRGLAQGPDGLLYIVVEIRGYDGFNVLAVDGRGEVVRRYTCHERLTGFVTGGGITFDAAGNFFVAAAQGLVYFVRDSAAPPKLVKISGEGIYDASFQSLITGPDGHLLLATMAHLLELTSSGVVVREIKPGLRFETLRSIAYDAPAGVLYATDQGRISKLDATTGRVLQQTALSGGSIIVLTSSGKVVVTDQYASPQVFAKDLRPLGAFAGEEQIHLTEVRIGRPGARAQGEMSGPGTKIQAEPDRGSRITIERNGRHRLRILTDSGRATPSGAAPTGSGFARGDFYATSRRAQTIAHYDAAGVALDPLELRLPRQAVLAGLAQGPDSLLYVVADLGSVGFAVLAVNRQGDIVKRYVSHNTAPRTLAFDAAGSFIVVTAGALVRFKLGDETSATAMQITGGSIRDPVYKDLVPLPDGNLLVALAYRLCEIRPDGTLVREIRSPLRLVDIQGVAYDAATRSVFVSMSGYTEQLHQVLQLDFATGELGRQATVDGVSYVVLAQDGKIVVGGYTGPQILTKDLRIFGAFARAPQDYLTQIRTGPSRE